MGNPLHPKFPSARWSFYDEFLILIYEPISLTLAYTYTHTCTYHKTLNHVYCIRGRLHYRLDVDVWSFPITAKSSDPLLMNWTNSRVCSITLNNTKKNSKQSCKKVTHTHIQYLAVRAKRVIKKPQKHIRPQRVTDVFIYLARLTFGKDRAVLGVVHPVPPFRFATLQRCMGIDTFVR